MKKNCGFLFAGAFFVLMYTGFAQDADKKRGAIPANATWQYYDSVATMFVFDKDTISALENYRRAAELNPNNVQLMKNYDKLNHQFIRSNQSLYNINP